MLGLPPLLYDGDQMKSMFFVWVCEMVLLAGGVYGDVLFSDSFNRPDSTDADASSVGMNGILAPLVYQESYEGSGAATSIQILSNQLNMAYGPGMANLYLGHNFIDALIVSAGGFSVSVDVVQISSAATDLANRFAGFGVGMTEAEAAAAKDMNDHPTTFRGGGSAAGVCDFFVDLAMDGNVRVWSRGTLLNTVPVGAVSGTLKAVFSCSDFNAGSAVTVMIYINGTLCDTRSFTWSDANANYIGLSGRATNTVIFDNLSIETSSVQLPRITVAQTDGKTVVREGGMTDQVLVSLSVSPLAYPVTIEAVDALDPDQVTVHPARLVFNADNWQTAQTITIAAIDDNDMERAEHDTSLAFTVTADAGSPYAGCVIPELTVQIVENDCGAWGFNPADFNLDCQVNLEDFFYFAQAWIECSLPDPDCQDFRL